MAAAVTRDGSPWTPKFIAAIDEETCIGCGRCYKVCGQNVLGMVGVTEEGDVVDSDDDDAIRKIMKVENPGACIGCEACFRVCPKDCQTHTTELMAA